MQRHDRRSLDERQLVDAAARTAEHREWRRGRGRGRRGQRCMQGCEQLRIVTVVALVAVFLAHRLPLTAGAAEELYMRRVTTRYQAAQHTSTAARERGSHELHIPCGAGWGTPLLT